MLVSPAPCPHHHHHNHTFPLLSPPAPPPSTPPIRPRVPLTRFRRMQGLAPRGYGWQHGDRGKTGTLPSSSLLYHMNNLLIQPPPDPLLPELPASGIKQGAGRRTFGQRGHRGAPGCDHSSDVNTPVPADGSLLLVLVWGGRGGGYFREK